MEGNHLITCDHYFVAPNGKQYKSAWGKIKILEDSFLGVKTNRNSSNWYAQVGEGDKSIIIAGCQINYAIKCDSVNTDSVEEYCFDATGIKVFERPTMIYVAQ